VLLPVLVLLAQAVSAQTAARPVRVWLGSSGSLAPGDPVQVYVETATDGYLVVLRAGTDGRIEVLFPGDPSSDSYAGAGTYEIRRPGDGPAFVAAEPTGSGVVLAALSPTPLRFDEFLSAGRWSPEALVASWSGAGAEGALADIVQRMAGAGYFNYDLVPYTVAPRSYPQQTALAVAPGYSNAVTVVLEPFPVFVCDPFLVVCDGLLFHRFLHRRLFHEKPFCDFGSSCGVVPPRRVLALAIRPRSSTAVVPARRAASQIPMRRRPPAPLAMEPRHGTVAVRVIPLGATPRAAVARKPTTAPSARIVTRPAARLVMPAVASATPAAERGLERVAGRAPASRAGAIAVPAAPVRSASVALARSSPRAVESAFFRAPARASAVGSASAAASRPRAIALPRRPAMVGPRR
jgi:uncharacterized protein DUF4384